MSNSPDQDNKYIEEAAPEIHIPDYVYEEIGPNFTPAIIIRKEIEELMRKPRHRL